MLLSAKIIKNYNNINNFFYGNEWIIRAGEANVLYFQLVDLNQDKLRYIPAVGATMSVKFPSIDDSAVLNITATMVASSDDRSIWSVSLASNQVPASGNVVFTLTEGGNSRKFHIINGIAVEYPGNDGSC